MFRPPDFGIKGEGYPENLKRLLDKIDDLRSEIERLKDGEEWPKIRPLASALDTKAEWPKTDGPWLRKRSKLKTESLIAGK